MPLARGIFFMYKTQTFEYFYDMIKKQFFSPNGCFLKVSPNTFLALIKGKGGVKIWRMKTWRVSDGLLLSLPL